MTDRADHYSYADRLLEEAKLLMPKGQGNQQLLAAIGHALLANTSGEVADAATHRKR